MALEQEYRSERNEIGEIALRLFADRGYEQVSLADIAEVAGVPVATLEGLIPSKEVLLLGPAADGPIWILDRVEAAPPSVDLMGLLTGVFEARIALYQEDLMQLWRLAALTAPPELQQLVALGVIERAALVAMVAERMGVDSKIDPRPSVMVTDVIGAVQEAYEIWLHGKSDRPLLVLLKESFSRIVH